MRFVLGTLLAVCVVSTAFARPEFRCDIELVCGHIEPCSDHGREGSTPLIISGSDRNSLILDFGHRKAEFDRFVQLENNAIFAHSLGETIGMQEMLTLMPTGNLILSSHHNQDIGIAITAFGMCERTR